ncbi:MAG: hypothetical protein ACREPY_09390 [Rhodanobacteraceae bacterium]
MHNMLMGPLWGVVTIASITGVITIACWVMMFRFLLHPGEKNRHHAKYDILRNDR